MMKFVISHLQKKTSFCISLALLILTFITDSSEVAVSHPISHTGAVG